MSKNCVVIFLCGLLFLPVIVAAQAVGDYRSRQDGNWSTAGSWQRCTSITPVTWNTASAAPTISNGVITISSTHTITVTTNVTADQVVVASGGTLLVNSGNTLTIADGGGVDLSVSGTMAVSGSLDISSGAQVDTNNNITIVSNSSGDGRLGPMQGTINGSITVERYVNNIGVRSYRYLASPITNGNIASWQASFPITGLFTGASTSAEWLAFPGMLSTSPSLYFYNQATEAYVAYPTTNNAAAVTNGVGYAAYFRDTNPITVSVTGTVRSGDVPINLTSTGAGYNLIGNPYPSAISWDLVDLTTLPQISTTYAVRDNTDQSGVGAGNFAYYQQGGGSSIPAGFDGTIAMGQAFWVQAFANSTITFQESNKILASSPIFFRKATSETKNVLRIKAEGLSNALVDETIVCFNEEAIDAMDRKDAVKRLNSKLNLSSFASDGKEMAINTFSNLPIDRMVILNLSGATIGDYKLNFSQLETFLALPTIELFDDFTKQSVNINLQNSTYNFSVTSDSLSYGDKRFRISIKNLVTSLEDENIAVSAYPNPISNQYTISLPKEVSFNGSIGFYNTIGQQVEPTLVNSTNSEKSFDFSNLQSGMFIVKIPTTNGVHLLKAIKK
jgi:hypothetical protein